MDTHDREKNRVPLYMCFNIEALTIMSKDETIKNAKNADKLPNIAAKLIAESLKNQYIDQEKCFLMGRRYLDVMDKYFKMCHDRTFSEICYRREYNKVKDVVKEVEYSLKIRYKELAQKREEAFEKKKTESAAIPAVTTPAIKFPRERPQSCPLVRPPAQSGPPKFITPRSLYSALTKSENILIIDIRPAKEFEDTHITTTDEHLINIPSQNIIPGMSAELLLVCIEKEISRKMWNARDTYEYLVLMDWDTDPSNFAGSRLERLRTIIIQWDYNRKYKQEPVILKGGLKEFIEWYPSEVTNSYLILSQTNSDLDDMLTLDDMIYPKTGDKAPRNPEATLSFTDLRARVIRDFGEEEYLTPFRSLSEESLPTDFVPTESGESTATTEVKSAAEVGFDKDVKKKHDKKSDDEQAIAKMSHDEERDKLLHKARAVKPKSRSKAAKAAAAAVMIKNLIDSNQELSLFQRPEIDRSQKPVDIKDFKPATSLSQRLKEIEQQQQEMVVGGYTGIRNVKNNCYMNCMLQCLKAVPLIKSMFVTTNSYVKHIHRKPPVITHQFGALMKTLWEGVHNKRKICYPQEFFDIIYEHNPTYAKGNHEDTFEFFLFLFNILSEDCSFDLIRPSVMTDRERSLYTQLQGRSSYFIELFYYQLVNTKTCWNCKQNNLSFESDSSVMLAVPAKEGYDLQQLLDMFMRDNLVKDYSCSACKSTSTIVNRKRIMIDPDVLVITLKRYIANSDGSFRKNENKIRFPAEKLEFGYSYYKLYAIPQHTGSLTHGHYYASLLLNEREDLWALFNDEIITEYQRAITQVPSVMESCVGFFYMRQGPRQYEYEI